MAVPYYGDYPEDHAEIRIPFNTFDSNDPSASVTITDLADSDIEVHADGNTTQIATDGASVVINFAGETGSHMVLIDSSVDAAYTTATEYAVKIVGTTIDGATVNAWIGAFSIERAGGALATALLTNTVVDGIAAKLVGISLLNEWLGAIAGKQNADATALTEIKATGAASGTYDPNTDSTEGLSDRLPAALSSGNMKSDMLAISTDATAANNLENAFDDTAGPVPWMGIVDQGTAQSASSTGVVLRAAAAFANDVLIGAKIMVRGSTQGYWQTRTIIDNALSGDSVTVDAWTVTPSGTITYKIIHENAYDVWDRLLTGATHNIATSAGRRLRQVEAAFVNASGTIAAVNGNHTVTLDAGAVGTAGYYHGGRLQIIEGTGTGQSRIITDYTAGKVAVLDSDWTTNPDTSSLYDVLSADVTVAHSDLDQAHGYVATYTNTTTITLDSLNAVATADYYNNSEIVFTHGTGAGQSRIITDYSAGRVCTLSPALEVALDTTTGYHIIPQRGTDGANTTVPDASGTAPTAVEVREEMDSNSTELAKIGTIPALDGAGQNIGAAIAKLADDNGGADYDATTDSLEKIRNRGDAAWTTGAGGSSPTVEQIRQEMDSNSTRLSAIETDTDEIGTAGAGLSDLGGMSTTMKGQVNAEADTALSDMGFSAPRKNVALADLSVFMVDSGDHVTPKTGLTLTVTRSLDGGAFGSGTGTAAEIANGMYQYDASQADMNADVIIFRFTGTDADDSFITIHTRS